MKYRLLFLCTGNSCRSQMAEAWTRHLWPDLFEVSSAGLKTRGLHKNSIKVMAEVGIDISRQVSKQLDSFLSLDFDYVITVCNQADDHSPIFSGATKRLHRGFDDPAQRVEHAKTPEEALSQYRRTRDEIGEFIRSLPGFLRIKGFYNVLAMENHSPSACKFDKRS